MRAGSRKSTKPEKKEKQQKPEKYLPEVISVLYYIGFCTST
jgi:hypothetical protein